MTLAEEAENLFIKEKYVYGRVGNYVANLITQHLQSFGTIEELQVSWSIDNSVVKSAMSKLANTKFADLDSIIEPICESVRITISSSPRTFKKFSFTYGKNTEPLNKQLNYKGD